MKVCLSGIVVVLVLFMVGTSAAQNDVDCCLGRQCITTTYDDCVQRGGMTGNLGDCDDPWFCPDTDCCFPDWSCSPNYPADQCAAEGGTIGPAGSCEREHFCAPEFTDCCLEGECYPDTPEQDCVAQDGVPLPAGMCLEVPDICLDFVTGACCYDGDYCEDDVAQSECSGTFAPSGACSDPGFCTKACCLPTGHCEDIPGNDCLSRQGTPQGLDSACTDPDVECGFCELPHNTMDFNQDCRVNLIDLSIFAQQWLDCRWQPAEDC